MLSFVAIMLAALLAAGPTPRQTLIASADACRAVSSLACDATHTYSVADEEQRIDRARTSFQRLSGDANLGARVRLDFNHPDTIVSYAYDGRELRMASHESRSITIRRAEHSPAAPITNSIAGKIITDNPVLRHMRLTSAADKRNSLTFAGTAQVDGVLCDVVRAAYPDSSDIVDLVVTFYIAQSDRLPRRADTRYRFPDGATPDEYSLILTNLQVNPELPESVFSLPAPEGYTEEIFSPAPGPEPLPFGSPAPDFQHADPDGKLHSLADYRGQWLLLDFWGTWCGPCLKALPIIQTIHEEFKDQRLAVVGLSCYERPKADPAALFQQKNLTYTLLLNGNDTAEAYRISAFPTLILIDPEGRIVARHVGNTADLAATLRATLEEHLKPG